MSLIRLSVDLIIINYIRLSLIDNNKKISVSIYSEVFMTLSFYINSESATIVYTLKDVQDIEVMPSCI